MTDWNPIAGQDPADRLDLDYDDADYGLCLWCRARLDSNGVCQCGKGATDEAM